MAIFSGGKVLDLAAAFGQGRQDGVAVRDGLVTREFDRTGDGAHGRNAFLRHGEILARSDWRREITECAYFAARKGANVGLASCRMTLIKSGSSYLSCAPDQLKCRRIQD